MPWLVVGWLVGWLAGLVDSLTGWLVGWLVVFTFIADRATTTTSVGLGSKQAAFRKPSFIVNFSVEYLPDVDVYLPKPELTVRDHASFRPNEAAPGVSNLSKIKPR